MRQALLRADGDDRLRLQLVDNVEDIRRQALDAPEIGVGNDHGDLGMATKAGKFTFAPRELEPRSPFPMIAKNPNSTSTLLP